MVVINRLNMAGNQVQAIKPIMATSILSTDNPSYYLFYKNRWKINPNNTDCDNENLKCRVTIQITQMRWKCQNRRFESHSTHFLPCDINLIPTLDSPQKWLNLRLFCDEQNESKDGDGEAEVHDNRGGHGRRLHALDDEVLRPERRQEKAEVNIEFYGDYPKKPECFIKIL